MTEFYRLPDAIAVAPLKGKKLKIVHSRENTDAVVSVAAADDNWNDSYRYLRSELAPWNMTANKDTMQSHSKNTLIDGNPMEPLSTDVIAQRINLTMGIEPRGEGWRILTGNERSNLWARVAYRYEIEE